MDVLDCIENRSSVRVYKDEPLSEREFDILVRAALRAPSAGNLLQYSIVAVTDQATKHQLCEMMGRQPFIKKAPLLMIFNADEHRIEKWLERWGGHFHFDGQYVFHIACSDALIASENVVLAAEALGLGSVYVGNVIGRANQVRQLLGYPRHVVPVALLCIGRPLFPPAKRERLSVRAILHKERYQDYTDEEMTEIYGGLESEWATKNPEGLTIAGGVKVRSRAEWTMNAHYTEEHIRTGDEEMKRAMVEAGFRL